MSKLDTSRLNELLAALRAKKAATAPTETPISAAISQTLEISPATPSHSQTLDRYGNLITLNSAQSEFVSLASSGKSCVLIGAAGTGKTTCQRAVTESLILSGQAGVLSAGSHKYLVSGTPGIVICAYTRRAVANIKRNLPANLQSNAITIHKLLEYQPVYYDVTDPNTGETKSTMRFEATRSPINPLPDSIRVIIYEESSMLGTDLYKQVRSALSHEVQEIFLGDIQQLPPVFGPAVLGFKLLELPVIELTEVYRQALESPIISLAHKVLSGKPIPASELPSLSAPPALTIRPWKKKLDEIDATLIISGVFAKMEQEKFYNPEEDMILIPFNKGYGTDELNKRIANYLAKKLQAPVHQVIAGFNRRYFREGEKVLYDKEDAVILKIESNPSYYGVSPLPASPTLDYWGYDSAEKEVSSASDPNSVDLDFVLGQMAKEESGDRVRAASHMITLRLVDSDQTVTLSGASDLNSLLYAYALTVHKAQGSEWRRVFLCFHHSHATMMQRELLYTAITRAREELVIFCEPNTFEKGIKSQKVKGNTLAEKAEYFKGKVESLE